MARVVENYFRGQSRILSDTQLRKLKEHRYSTSSASLLDPWLQGWWNWLVLLLPTSLAPNLITIVGLAVNIFTSIILIYHAPKCKEEAPAWACFLCAVGIFFYQSLDAIDGKQARRTNSSSPLGELFDHGCDSLSTVFVSLAVCASCQLGDYPPLMFIQCFLSITLFYCAHWQTYVSGTLHFGIIDVTEAQFGIMAVHIVSAIYGTAFWTEKLPLGIPRYMLYVSVALIGAFRALFWDFKTILYGGAGKNGSSIAGTSVLSPIIPISLVLVPAVLIAWKSDESVFEESPALYILTFGLVAAKVTNRLVVAHMTKSEMEYLDVALIGPFALFMNQYCNYIVREKYLLWFALLLASAELWRYSSKVCVEICDSLDIFLFRIGPKKGSKTEGSPPMLRSTRSRK